MADPVSGKKRTKLAKESPETTRPEPKKGAKLPKVKARDRDPGPALSDASKQILKTSFDFLCYPPDDNEMRLADWIEIHARKDGKIGAFVSKQAEHYPNLVRFKPSQYLASLQAQEIAAEKAKLYLDALCVSQSHFSSANSYKAAREVVRLVAKGVARSTEQLLEDLKLISKQGITVSELTKARSDIGTANQVMEGLVSVAVAMQYPDMEEEEFALQAQTLNLLLKKLARKTARQSAPTINMTVANELPSKSPSAKLEYTVSPDSPRKDEPATPREKVKRDGKSDSKKKTGIETATEKGAPRQDSSSDSVTKEKKSEPAPLTWHAAKQTENDAPPSYTPSPPPEEKSPSLTPPGTASPVPVNTTETLVGTGRGRGHFKQSSTPGAFRLPGLAAAPKDANAPNQ